MAEEALIERAVPQLVGQEPKGFDSKLDTLLAKRGEVRAQWSAGALIDEQLAEQERPLARQMDELKVRRTIARNARRQRAVLGLRGRRAGDRRRLSRCP